MIWVIASIHVFITLKKSQLSSSIKLQTSCLLHQSLESWERMPMWILHPNINTSKFIVIDKNFDRDRTNFFGQLQQAIKWCAFCCLSFQPSNWVLKLTTAQSSIWWCRLLQADDVIWNLGALIRDSLRTNNFFLWKRILMRRKELIFELRQIITVLYRLSLSIKSSFNNPAWQLR